MCRLRRQWSGRRYKSTVLLMIETITQVVNLCFFILPNAYVLARPCGWRDPIVLWSNFVIFSCWNTLFLTFVVQSTLLPVPPNPTSACDVNCDLSLHNLSPS